MLHWDLLLRIAVATLLGGAIGFERDRRGRPAGLRTHMIVALASATFMVVSTHFLEHQHYGPGQRIDVDVSRIAASIVTGIGFLGGGAIMRTGLNVHGLTTAAGLWLVGAIGMAAGSGMYVVAVFVTALGLVSLGALRRLEDKDDRFDVRRVQVMLRSVASTQEVAGRMLALGAQVSTVHTERDLAQDSLTVLFDVRVPKAADSEALVHTLEACPGVERVSVVRSES